MVEYRKLKASMANSSRYFFVPILIDDDGEGGVVIKRRVGFSRSERRMNKYILSDQKSFASLFFPEKENVLRLLDDFLLKRGKFAIPGFPNKLGLLLHGPPGTGKTSLIKSIAHYAKRHIIDVPLAKIATNQELFDLMFNLVFRCEGEEDVTRMTLTDILFVLEDVDAASSVVLARDCIGAGGKMAAPANRHAGEHTGGDNGDESRRENIASKGASI